LNVPKLYLVDNEKQP